MTKLSLTLIVIIVGLTAISSADGLSKIKNANPGATPYQILQDLYETSNVPAALTDFDLASDRQSNQQCAAAVVDSPEPYLMLVARNEGIIKSGTPGTGGTPSKGPLFPGTPGTAGTPDQKGSYLVFSVTTVRSTLRNYNIASKSQINVTSTDLVDTFTDDSNSESVIIINARKNGQLIAIHALINAGSSKQKDVYSYCYRQ